MLIKNIHVSLCSINLCSENSPGKKCIWKRICQIHQMRWIKYKYKYTGFEILSNTNTPYLYLYLYLQIQIRIWPQPCWLVSSDLVMLMPSDEFHRTLMMTNHLFRKWFGAIRQQAIIQANVDPDLCCHMETLSTIMSGIVFHRPSKKYKLLLPGRNLKAEHQKIYFGLLTF